MKFLYQSRLIAIATMLFATYPSYAQIKMGGTAGAGDPSSVLELQSTGNNQGFLPPRITTAQRNAISTPAEGLMIYNTDEHCVDIYKGTTGGWYNTCSGGGSLSFTNCNNPVNKGTINQGVPAVDTVVLSYTNNTGATYGVVIGGASNGISLQTMDGTNVATLVSGSGTISLIVSGTPTVAGAITVPVILAGTSCNVAITAGAFPGNIPVACTAPGRPCPTTVVTPANAVAGDSICWGGFAYGVVSYGGRLWLDRNLGATAVPTSITDVNGYGDDYQWGRKGDGHQCVNPTKSGTTNTQATGIDANNGGLFIPNSSSPNYTWTTYTSRSSLWDSSATGGVNNPCPAGWRVPAMSEWNATGITGASQFTTPLKMPMGTGRSIGGTYPIDASSRYWSVTLNTANTAQHWILYAINSAASLSAAGAEYSAGLPVRCIKN